MKILNITHNDLDGIVSQLMVELYYGRENVKVERCNYNNVNGTLYNYLKSGEHENYDLIYITDISISEKMAEWVNKDYSGKVRLIDHHATAKWLTKYDWAIVETHYSEGVPVSACELVRCYFDNNNPKVLEIVKNADDYDTWKWSTNGNLEAKRMNDLMDLIGIDEMLDYLHSQIKGDSIAEKMKDKYDFMLKMRDKEYKHYLEASDKSLNVCKYDEYNVGVVMAERFTSELGNDLAKLHPELDFIAILNMRSGLSLRGVKDIDLGAIAKDIGNKLGLSGGGHKSASAVSLTNNYKLNFLSNIFEIGVD